MQAQDKEIIVLRTRLEHFERKMCDSTGEQLGDPEAVAFEKARHTRQGSQELNYNAST